MSGFNVVKFTVKDGMDDKFISDNKTFNFDVPGFKRGNMIKTGDHDYCFIAEWDSAEDSMNAEAKMVAMLDCFRDTLEERANGNGVTDFIVGDTVVAYQ
jgi:hypothetical protein